MACLICGDLSYDVPSFDVASTILRMLGYGRHVRLSGTIRIISYVSEADWNTIFEHGGKIMRMDAYTVQIRSKCALVVHIHRNLFNAIFNEDYNVNVYKTQD